MTLSTEKDLAFFSTPENEIARVLSWSNNIRAFVASRYVNIL